MYVCMCVCVCVVCVCVCVVCVCVCVCVVVNNYVAMVNCVQHASYLGLSALVRSPADSAYKLLKGRGKEGRGLVGWSDASIVASYVERVYSAILTFKCNNEAVDYR
jgi:hypothetical protein